MAVLTGYDGTFEGAAYKHEVETFATTKVVTRGGNQIFLRGILANRLITLSIFLSVSGP